MTLYNSTVLTVGVRPLALSVKGLHFARRV